MLLAIRYRGWVLLAILMIVSFAMGATLRYLGLPIFYGYPIIMLLLLATYLHSYILELFAGFVERLSASKMLFIGRPLPPRYAESYAVIIQMLSYSVVVSIAIGATYFLAYGYIPMWLLLTVFIMMTILVVIALLPNLQVLFIVSSRKTSAEIELPFLLLLFKVLSSTHLTLYDMLNAVENSSVLRSWSNEVRSAKRIASVLGSSLATAMGVVSENHPSQIVREIFRRLLVVAISVGSIRDVAEKAFGQIYSQLEMRLSSLVDKLTIVNGVLIFGFLFIPITFAVVAPIYGGSPAMSFVIPLAFFSLFFFIIYATVANMYPSSFEITPPKILSYLSIASFSLMAMITLFSGFSLLIRGSSFFADTALPVVLLVIAAPATIYSELWLRKARVYDKFIRLAMDASTVSASLGENFVSVLKRLAPRYGRDVEKIVDRIVLAQVTSYLREEIVRDAPSMFHAAFIETLMHAISMGAKQEMVKELTSSYEHLMNSYSKLVNTARTQEMMIIGLVAMLSIFLGFIKNIFTGFAEALNKLAAQGAWRASLATININPLTFNILFYTIMLALLFLSAIVGKMRGGSIAYGFRTAVIMITLFSIGMTLSKVFASQVMTFP